MTDGSLLGRVLAWPSRLGVALASVQGRVVLTPVAVASLALVLLWTGLGDYGLFNNNEGLYASIAQDMLERQDWVTPHLNGVPYLEKPPLFYYLLTAAFALFGANEWAARGLSALAACGCLWCVYWVADRLAGRTAALLSTLMLVSCLGFVMLARAVMPDMLLIATFTVAMLGSYLAWRRGNVLGYCLSLAALAAAVLTKGLLALVLFGGVWFFFLVTRWRDGVLQPIRFLLHPLAWLVFLLVAAPWHVAAMQLDGDFAWFYFINEHVLRFLGQRIPADTYSGSPLYYLPRVLLLFFPWVLMLPTALHARPPAALRDLDRFLAIASVLVIAFFTAATAKANYYVVLALPFVVLWMALRLANREADGPPAWTLGLIGGMTVAVLVAGMWAVSLEVRWETIVHRWNWEALYTSLALIAVAAALLTFIAQGRLSRWLLPVSATFLSLSFALGVAKLHDVKLSARKLIEATQEKCSLCTITLYRDYEALSAVSFYADQDIVPVIDSESNDLWWGQVKNPHASTFITSEDAFARALRGEQIAVVVAKHQRKDFLASPLGINAKRIASRGGTGSYLIRTEGRSLADFVIPLP